MAEKSVDSGRVGTTRAVTRGARRLLRDLGFAVLEEFPLPNGQRADLLALSPAGVLRIVEVKSCREDFRVDSKWSHYPGFCDHFCFAVANDFDPAPLPADAGLIVADGHGGLLVRDSPALPLAPMRRRAMLVRFGVVAARRYGALAFDDPPD
jgi:hypothetical protein